MTAQQFSAGNYTRQNEPQDREEGSFNTRVTVTEGTKPQSNSRLVQAKPGGLDNPTSGNIHRNTVGNYVHPTYDHKPYTSVHRPDHSPSEPFDPSALKAHQERMITDKQKAKNKRAK